MHNDPRIELRRALERNPGDGFAWILLAEHELDRGDAAAGAMAAQRALALRPGHPEALARLGRAQWMQGQRGEAVASLRAAAANAPDHPGIAVWLGHALEDAGEAEAASQAYARAHALAPDEPQLAAYLLAWRRKLCDWRDLDALARQVRDAVNNGSASVEPFAFLSEDASALEQLRCARLRAGVVAAAVRTMPPPEAAAAGPIRVGFLSNGFGAHPTGLLTAAMFERLKAQTDMEIHLFALNDDDGSPIRQRLQAAAHTLHDVSMRAHAQVATAIRAAGIDVLFDLRGWGGGGAPEVLAMRPAPVQVNWLAYPGTSGAPWIDHVLADRFVLPETMAHAFSENVVWLPRCFQPSDTTRALLPPPSRAQCGLPERGTDGEGVVFCCFNNSYKLNPRSVTRALAVLRDAPGSVLWLLSGPGHADARLGDVARMQGVDPARLVFMPKQPHAEYMARLQHADLFLDTEPYNAHTTASDALWAGCPVLTRPGETFAARVAGSLNHHLGMMDMNVADDAAFVARAVALGRDPRALDALKDELALRRSESGLFDMGGFARDFADAVRAMARR
ncbi:UDP-N-acetylglucosamine-peptide N-acetylglucosaminyltransferase [Lysobacter sp. S4-A87]|uniref:O-linked N-acetylglucosamine transferase, SPINDLY family protein n=1 Tax=Lysobacter sp. S4-A87 TaxID=2925843 RepID=UPI001F539B8B|nr:UDP-N-acetylglucosamine-peptide N-acetylglucosaminyltransferase [Lysobacter sp. S4-A87]UNK49136.1 UDP-N-acetylglucosamine-peptide N-acetylglucosaminyltransferase [Lysobacter sp. S4-A87]